MWPTRAFPDRAKERPCSAGADADVDAKGGMTMDDRGWKITDDLNGISLSSVTVGPFDENTYLLMDAATRAALSANAARDAIARFDRRRYSRDYLDWIRTLATAPSGSGASGDSREDA